MRLSCCGWLAIGLVASSPAWSQGTPHVHGAARLEVVVEASQVTLQLELPLDSLVGFEHAPRGAAQIQRAAAAVQALNAADALFKFTPAARCVVHSVVLESAALNLGPRAAADTPPSDHADVDATYVFTCADTPRATEVDIGLFEAFSRLQQVTAEVATAKGQFKRALTRPAKRVSLVR